MFKKLLVPTDGSDLSNSTVLRAVSFAKEAGASIVALYAKSEFTPLGFAEGMLVDPAAPERFNEIVEEEAAKVLQFVSISCAEMGVPCELVSVENDSPYKAIISTAESKGCDLIFMSSHGRGGIGALILGSETNKVLTHTNIPVLVYR